MANAFGMSRRRFLQGGAGLVGGMAAFATLSDSARAALATVAASGSTLADVDHVVVLMQENRSFDHYFGTLSGVLGFDDPNARVDPLTGRSVFAQLDPQVLDGAGGTLLPWHLDSSSTSAQCLLDIDHIWQTQHLSIDGGANDLFVTAHVAVDGALGAGSSDPSQLTAGGSRVMGYFTRADLPFHYALADAFTVCDRYFCSVIGPTYPNRHYLMSAWIDPDGTNGGPEVNNLKTSGLSWRTYPEQLEAAGIDWYLYREHDDYQDNVLDFFVQYQDASTELYRRGRSVIPDGQLLTKLRDDVVSGNLPQVSWIVNSEATSEHPNHRPADGAHFIQGVLEALTADPAVWAKTLLILTYDENGGFFDHVSPPLAPPGTPGEYLTAQGLVRAPEAAGLAGPIGLGPRVPTILISPFTRGGYVCSDTFDHTSILQLLEARFGAEIPNITAWRRATCGDLSSAINFAGTPDLAVPALPDTAELAQAALEQCGSSAAPVVPSEQVMPRQEPGTRPRPSAVAGGPSVNAAPDVAPVGVAGTEVLPATGGSRPAALITAATVAALGLHRLRERTSTPR